MMLSICKGVFPFKSIDCLFIKGHSASFLVESLLQNGWQFNLRAFFLLARVVSAHCPRYTQWIFDEAAREQREKYKSGPSICSRASRRIGFLFCWADEKRKRRFSFSIQWIFQPELIAAVGWKANRISGRRPAGNICAQLQIMHFH